MVRGVHQAGFRRTGVRLVVPAGPLGCLLVGLPGCWGVGHGVASGPGAWDSEEVGDGVVTVFVCGDVMPGRGVDQILPHPGDPELREPYARDARAYVDLAEDAHGPIPRPAGFGWPWGDALRVLEEIAPDVRVINLETSITASRGFAPGKAICYRMSPGNVAAWRRPGRTCARWRTTTCSTSAAAGWPTPCGRCPARGCGRRGPGRTATRPGGRRPSRCAAAGAPSSCPPVPPAAGSRRAGRPPGPARGQPAPRPVAGHRRRRDRPGAGGPAARRRRGGLHPLGIELGIRRGRRPGSLRPRPDRRRRQPGPRPFLAPSAADRGVPGQAHLVRLRRLHQRLRGHHRPPGLPGDLRLLYFASLEAGTGQLTALRMAPMRTRKMRLHPAPAADRQWLRTVLDQISRGFGSRVDLRPDGMLALRLTR